MTQKWARASPSWGLSGNTSWARSASQTTDDGPTALFWSSATSQLHSWGPEHNPDSTLPRYSQHQAWELQAARRTHPVPTPLLPSPDSHVSRSFTLVAGDFRKSEGNRGTAVPELSFPSFSAVIRKWWPGMRCSKAHVRCFMPFHLTTCLPRRYNCPHFNFQGNVCPQLLVLLAWLGHPPFSLREESGDTTLPSSEQWEDLSMRKSEPPEKWDGWDLTAFPETNQQIEIFANTAQTDWICRPCLPKMDLLLDKCNDLWENKDMISIRAKSLGLESAVHGTVKSYDFKPLNLQLSHISNWDNSTGIIAMWWGSGTVWGMLFVLRLYFMDSATWHSA